MKILAEQHVCQWTRLNANGGRLASYYTPLLEASLGTLGGDLLGGRWDCTAGVPCAIQLAGAPTLLQPRAARWKAGRRSVHARGRHVYQKPEQL